MMLAFQIILAIILVISFFGIIGEEENENLRNILGYVTVSAILALVATFIF